MELTDTISTLRAFNAWRRCDDDTLGCPDVRLIGQAIDSLCDHAERLQRDLEQEQQDHKESDRHTMRALGERNDARSLADSLAACINDLSYEYNPMAAKKAYDRWEEFRK